MVSSSIINHMRPDGMSLSGRIEHMRGRSTIVLVTANQVDPDLLAQRFPITKEGRKWHVLEVGYANRAAELWSIAQAVSEARN